MLLFCCTHTRMHARLDAHERTYALYYTLTLTFIICIFHTCIVGDAGGCMLSLGIVFAVKFVGEDAQELQAV